ncbi:hypothetical protein ACH42_01460 [Endozoicomonas sp. (ex Bugula neritina AB1)]|nr:hypothetical protein ACH42_01460 [Endozoicomonas sp. (ex Bugula neritina AB1)]
MISGILFLCLNLLNFAHSKVIDWTTETGKKRLLESTVNNDFFTLANYYQAQDNKFFCGVASASIVLNALRINKPEVSLPLAITTIKPEESKFFPKGEWTPFFKKYSQDNILDQSIRQHIMGKPYSDSNNSAFGLTLSQLAGVLKDHELNVKTVYAETPAHIEDIKKELIQTINDKTSYIILNYSRQALNQSTSGHFSLIGAYHSASDSFLIMDVSNVKTHWVWVDTNTLFKAMHAVDTASKKSRGYVLVSEGRQ